MGEREVTHRALWREVNKVIARKLDLYAYDEIWVELLDESGRVLVAVSEASGSFGGFIGDLPRCLAGCKRPEEWWDSVAHPAFARNETELYGRDDGREGT